MKLQAYSIHDQAAKAFINPFFMHNDGLAIRAFSDNVNSKDDNNIAKHPDQFTLYHLGSFDDEKGALIENDSPRSLGNGITFLLPDQQTSEIQEIKKSIDSLFDVIKHLNQDL